MATTPANRSVELSVVEVQMCRVALSKYAQVVKRAVAAEMNPQVVTIRKDEFTAVIALLDKFK